MLPIAELHLHLEGTLEPETIFAIAERNRVSLPYEDIDELRSRYAFTDLQSFLDLCYANVAVLLAAQDFSDMTTAYLDRARAAGVRHAEVFLNPRLTQPGASRCEKSWRGWQAPCRSRYGLTA